MQCAPFVQYIACTSCTQQTQQGKMLGGRADADMLLLHRSPEAGWMCHQVDCVSSAQLVRPCMHQHILTAMNEHIHFQAALVISCAQSRLCRPSDWAGPLSRTFSRAMLQDLAATDTNKYPTKSEYDALSLTWQVATLLPAR